MTLGIAHAAAGAPACLLLVMTLGIGIGKCVHAPLILAPFGGADKPAENTIG
jgi:hypothetical protein